MNKIKKLVIIFLVAVLSLSSVIANGQKEESGKKVLTLSIWDENQKPTIQKIIDAYNMQSDEYEAVLELTPWNQYWTKLDAAAGANQAADVFWMNVYLPKYVDGDVLLPLDDFVKENDVDLTNYVETTLNMFNYKDNLWALPKGMDTVVVAYNKGIFDKYGVSYPTEGWSWDDMRDIATELKNNIAKNGGSEYPILMELDAQPSHFNFAYQTGGSIINETWTKSGYASKDTVESYQNVVDLFNDELLAPYTVLSETKGTDLFLSKRGAIVFIGSWKASVLENSSLAKEGNLGLITMPKQDSGNTSVLGGLGYAIFKNTKYPEGCFDLISFITSEQGNKIQGEDGIDIPAYKTAQKYYKDHFVNIDAQAFFDAANDSVPFPAGPDINAWFGIINDNVARIYAQELSAQEGCDIIYNQMQEILDK
ncbi:MAG: ABC transporter substrate-binding protein [Pleomorphochaeta sp.]